MGIKSKTHFHTPNNSRWWKCAWLEQVTTSCPLRKAMITLFRGEMSERISFARTVTERKENRTLREKVEPFRRR